MPPFGGTVVTGETGAGGICAPEVVWYATRGGGNASKGDVGADARLNAFDDGGIMMCPGWTLDSIEYAGGK